MKKPGAGLDNMIPPHHVFQLQCIVDSFSISRGWDVGALRGHVLTALAPDFRPRRDMDRFMDDQREPLKLDFLDSADT